MLTRATRSPKYSRRRCFLQGSIQRGETFTVLVFKIPSGSTMLITTAWTAAYAKQLVIFFILKCRLQFFLKQDSGSPWKDIVRKTFDSSLWRIQALKLSPSLITPRKSSLVPETYLNENIFFAGTFVACVKNTPQCR